MMRFLIFFVAASVALVSCAANRPTPKPAAATEDLQEDLVRSRDNRRESLALRLAIQEQQLRSRALKESVDQPVRFAEVLQSNSQNNRLIVSGFPPILSREAMSIVDYESPRSAPGRIVRTWTTEVVRKKNLLLNAIDENEARSLNTVAFDLVPSTVIVRLFNTPYIGLVERLEISVRRVPYFTLIGTSEGVIRGFGNCPDREKGLLNAKWTGRCEYRLAIRPSFSDQSKSHVEIGVIYLEKRNANASWQRADDVQFEQSRAIELYKSIISNSKWANAE